MTKRRESASAAHPVVTTNALAFEFSAFEIRSVSLLLPGGYVP